MTTFNVYARENVSDLKTTLATGLTSPSYSVAGLTKGKKYLFSIGAEKNGIEKVSDEKVMLFGEVWTPHNIAAAVFTTDTLSLGALSNWIDEKTSIAISQASASKQPAVVSVGSSKVVRFDSVDDVLFTSNLSFVSLIHNKSNAWAFVVYRQNGEYSNANINYKDLIRFNASTHASIFGLFASTPTQNYKPTVGSRRIISNAAQFCSAVTGTQSDPVKMAMGEADFVNQTFRTYVNTINENTLTTGFGSGTTSTDAVNFTVGGYLGSADEYFKGDIYAIIFGNTEISLPDRQKLEGWAAHKYGLTGNLPANHPYKTLIPTL